MRHAIIGSGAIGRALAVQFARVGLETAVANSRGPHSLEALRRELGDGVHPVDLATALASEVVILAVPFDAASDVLAQAGDFGGRILVDATNAIDFPAFTPRDLSGRASSEIVAGYAAGARVVKAFNTIPAARLAEDPARAGGRRVVVLSGDTPRRAGPSPA